MLESWRDFHSLKIRPAILFWWCCISCSENRIISVIDEFTIVANTTATTYTIVVKKSDSRHYPDPICLPFIGPLTLFLNLFILSWYALKWLFIYFTSSHVKSAVMNVNTNEKSALLLSSFVCGSNSTFQCTNNKYFNSLELVPGTIAKHTLWAAEHKDILLHGFSNKNLTFMKVRGII